MCHYFWTPAPKKEKERDKHCRPRSRHQICHKIETVSVENITWIPLTSSSNNINLHASGGGAPQGAFLDYGLPFSGVSPSLDGKTVTTTGPGGAAFVAPDNGFLRSFWLRVFLNTSADDTVPVLAAVYRLTSTSGVNQTFTAISPVVTATLPASPAGTELQLKSLHLHVPIKQGDALVLGIFGTSTASSAIASAFGGISFKVC
jgi:hypothetical protein